ncbi:hypothetical protein [Nostoc sp. 106C]|uniref:hypothetical protein n=1 Tax=Nostoc sp. 106C TaxID=1932667 RepID=UPI001180249F|nr:hypothetical protein [Nostoc sp. 106C]
MASIYVQPIESHQVYVKSYSSIAATEFKLVLLSGAKIFLPPEVSKLQFAIVLVLNLALVQFQL